MYSTREHTVHKQTCNPIEPWNFGLCNMLGTLVFATCLELWSWQHAWNFDFCNRALPTNVGLAELKKKIPFLQHDCNMLEVGATVRMTSTEKVQLGFKNLFQHFVESSSVFICSDLADL